MGARHTTCHVDTFTTVAADTTAPGASEPPVTGRPSVAARTFAMIRAATYEHTSDDVVFDVRADRQGLRPEDRERVREEFFARPRACLRASDLGKRHGWGVHSNAFGHVALSVLGSPEYEAFASGTSPFTGEPVTVKAAMGSSRR